jgi:hypothetical protein
MPESGVSKKADMRLASKDASGTDVAPDITPFEEEDVAPEDGIVIPLRPAKRGHHEG